MQKKQGISLIVLVITIIVMIILAAAVVIALNNTGIIDKASHAVKLTDEKQVQDLASLAWAEAYLDENRTDTIENVVKGKLAEQGVTDADWNINVTDTGVKVTSKENTPSVNPNEGIKVTLPNGEGTDEKPYYLSTVEDFTSLATQVNEGYSTEGVLFSLIKDIDLTTVSNWIPIGSETYPFKGIFDGNGLSIYNLTSTIGGLFGDNYGEIKDLLIENVDVIVDRDVLGAVVKNNYGTIDNCRITNFNIEGGSNIGGIVGNNYNLLINSSVSNGELSGDNYVGGIVAINRGELSNSSASNAIINGLTYIGGIVGINYNKLTDCSAYDAEISGDNYVGGVTADNRGNIVNSSISSGTITGLAYVGGLVGTNTNNIENSSVDNTTPATICGNNTGTIIDCIIDGMPVN